MGESISAILGSATQSISLDNLSGIVGQFTGSLVNMIPAPLMAIYQQYAVPCLIAAVCLLVLLAFEGYKIFKMLMFIGSAALFGIGGHMFLAPLIPEAVRSMIPGLVNVDALVAILCGLLALFLTKCAYSFMLMVLGGAAGYYIGSTFVYTLLLGYFNTLTFLQNDIVKYIVGGICAAILALLFVLLFKHVYIVLTSFGGMIGAALVAQSMLIPQADQNIKLCCAILGLSIGIFAVVRQYREEEKALEIVF